MLRSPLRPNRSRRSLFRNPRSRYGLTPAAGRFESASGRSDRSFAWDESECVPAVVVRRIRGGGSAGSDLQQSWLIVPCAYSHPDDLERQKQSNRQRRLGTASETADCGPLGGFPDTASFGASIIPERDEVKMEIWLRNESAQASTRLRTQICVLLKGAASFNAQTNENKIFGKTAAAVQSAAGNRWIVTEWERCGRTWGNAQCPCLHSDPVLPDCPPGQTVKVSGRLWFAEGEQPINRAL